MFNALSWLTCKVIRRQCHWLIIAPINNTADTSTVGSIHLRSVFGLIL